MKGTSRIVAVVVIVCAVLSCFLASNASAEIKFGILPRLSAVEMTEMFSPLAAYLSKELEEKVALVIPKDYETFTSMVAGGQVDIGLSNPVIYIQLKKKMNIEPLALMAEAKGGTQFRGLIIARKDSVINKLQDLKGKKLIFVDKNAAGGYIFQMFLLNKAGFNVKKDFIMLPFAKKHDNVARAVFNRAADAGGIREDDFPKMKDDVDLSQLKIVAFTDYFPNHVVIALPDKLGNSKMQKIKAALLRLMNSNPEYERVLGAAKLVGFSPASDKDFDRLRQAGQLAGVL